MSPVQRACHKLFGWPVNGAKSLVRLSKPSFIMLIVACLLVSGSAAAYLYNHPTHSPVTIKDISSKKYGTKSVANTKSPSPVTTTPAINTSTAATESQKSPTAPPVAVSSPPISYPSINSECTSLLKNGGIDFVYTDSINTAEQDTTSLINSALQTYNDWVNDKTTISQETIAAIESAWQGANSELNGYYQQYLNTVQGLTPVNGHAGDCLADEPAPSLFPTVYAGDPAL